MIFWIDFCQPCFLVSGYFSLKLWSISSIMSGSFIQDNQRSMFRQKCLIWRNSFLLIRFIQSFRSGTNILLQMTLEVYLTWLWCLFSLLTISYTPYCYAPCCDKEMKWFSRLCHLQAIKKQYSFPAGSYPGHLYLSHVLRLT